MSRIKDYLMDIENGRIVPGAINDKCVCSEHFSDTALQEIVKQEGHRGKCSYCDILTELASMIHQFDLCTDLSKDKIIFRARPISQNTPLTFNEITCPPDDCAKQNRMSPAGVSMFYGAFDEETARMECTPKSRHDGKGRFLIGQFTPKRNFQLIDLTALPMPSFWQHKRDTREALAFMHIFHNEITKRIKPDDRIHTEYVPSQVFTEYLRYMFKLEGEIDVDGLIYKSSVNNNKCVVVFCNQKDSKDYFELVKIEDKII